jgi:4'-phosphopantetheinyl transferase
MNLLCQLATQSELRAGMADPASWLGTTERARLATLGTETRRQSFLAGRWLARLAVQNWCGVKSLPKLEVADSGACHVASRDGGVFVSISHSGQHVAAAVAGVPVGVDLESLDRPRDYLALARSVHSAAQQEQLARLAPSAQAHCFLQAWTLKEAWLKARGQGLDFALMRELEFDEDPHGDIAVAEVGGLILAVAADPALPPVIAHQPDLSWRRCRTRRSAIG